jgi:hypothetical protein
VGTNVLSAQMCRNCKGCIAALEELHTKSRHTRPADQPKQTIHAVLVALLLTLIAGVPQEYHKQYMGGGGGVKAAA